MASKAKCVHCGKDVFEFATECPFCHKPVANKHAPTNVDDAPWTWGKTSHKKNMPIGIIAACLTIAVIAGIVLYVIIFK